MDYVVSVSGKFRIGAGSRSPAGQAPGLIHDVPTVKELVDRIVSEAEEIIRERPTGSLPSAVAAE